MRRRSPGDEGRGPCSSGTALSGGVLARPSLLSGTCGHRHHSGARRQPRPRARGDVSLPLAGFPKPWTPKPLQEEEDTGLFPQVSSPTCGRGPHSGPSCCAKGIRGVRAQGVRSSRDAPVPGFPCPSITGPLPQPFHFIRTSSGPRKGCPPHCTSAHLPPPRHLTLPAAGFLPQASRQQPRSLRPPAGGCVRPAGSGGAGPTWLAARSQWLPPPWQEPSEGSGTKQASGRGWPSNVEAPADPAPVPGAQGGSASPHLRRPRELCRHGTARQPDPAEHGFAGRHEATVKQYHNPARAMSPAGMLPAGPCPGTAAHRRPLLSLPPGETLEGQQPGATQ